MMDTPTLRLTILCLTSLGVLSLIGCTVLHAMSDTHTGGLCELTAMVAGVLAGLAWPQGRDGAHPRPTPPPAD